MRKSDRRPFCVVSLLSIDSGVREDEAVAELFAKSDYREGMHMVPPMTASSDLRNILRRKYRSCILCHPKSVAEWQASKHSSSYITLAQLRRDGDERCVGCHVTKYDKIGNHYAARIEDAAVTCRSCHGQGPPSRAVCLTCHTAVTDPDSKFELHVNVVCPGDVAGGTDACSRRN